MTPNLSHFLNFMKHRLTVVLPAFVVIMLCLYALTIPSQQIKTASTAAVPGHTTLHLTTNDSMGSPVTNPSIVADTLSPSTTASSVTSQSAVPDRQAAAKATTSTPGQIAQDTTSSSSSSAATATTSTYSGSACTTCTNNSATTSTICGQEVCPAPLPTGPISGCNVCGNSNPNSSNPLTYRHACPLLCPYSVAQ